MESGQIFALVWGVIAISFGIWLLTKRHHIAQLARAERERKGTSLGQRTQTPIALGVAGTLFLVIGLVVTVSMIVVMQR
ncbi:hypothetical protein [Salinibacterium sp. ZJ454]|uniref:hypothetical protein n=1 Tax=Salinibacterium sp. ZJ454 TaxID=2708339 RepID=UPI00141F7859|nr:hypothetical protein [Salinibacterium sp. ZJ454]